MGLPLILVSATAAADGVSVRITNDGTEDVVVTVYDLSTRPRTVILENARINGFATLPVSVAADSSGRATIAWTAVSVDPNSRKCGHAESVQTDNSAAVTVHADSNCGA
jgi:hypothetical protein